MTASHENLLQCAVSIYDVHNCIVQKNAAESGKCLGTLQWLESGHRQKAGDEFDIYII